LEGIPPSEKPIILKIFLFMSFSALKK